jgi:Uma2 family endonuclease
MAALPALITVEQFRQLPDDGRAYELHHGEVVCVTRPKSKHFKMQCHTVEVLQRKVRGFGRVVMELPYRPVAEFDLRVADVAFVAQLRWDEIDPEDNLRGAPDLVIEIKSPSNTNRELRELASLCLANGARQFWIADIAGRCVTVVDRDGSTSVFQSGQSIPLTPFGADAVTVDELFAES